MIEQQQQETPRKRIREMTLEELRAYKRASVQKSRDKKRAEEEAEKAIDIHEFWAANRASLSTDELAELQAKDSDVRDQMWWMRCQIDGSYKDPSSPHYCDPNDAECYIGLDEGIADLVEFVKDHPCPRTYAWNSSGGALSNKWSMEKFWADPATMELITAEGYATEVWARYGYWAGIEDAKIYFFLVEELPKLGRARWTHDAASKLIGMVTSGDNTARYPKVSP
jgi:hypothetical protein